MKIPAFFGRMLVGAVSLSFLATGPASAQSPSGQCEIVPLRYEQKSLPNGLRLIVIPAPYGAVSMQIVVTGGTRSETLPAEAGMAHLFEHMMFRGTRAFPADVYAATLARIGARQNALSTDDFTNFQTTFASRDLATVVEMEADRFRNLEYSEADLRSLARSIAEEYRRTMSNPTAALFELQRKTALPGHPYGHGRFGTPADIEALPGRLSESHSYFERTYAPDRTTILLVGDVDPAKAMALLEKHWSPWRGGGREQPPPSAPERGKPVAVHLPWPARTQPLIAVSFRSPAFSPASREHLALEMLLEYWFGPRSEIYRRLVVQDERVDRFVADLGSHTDPSLATIFARVVDPRDLTAVRDEILKTVALARRQAIPEEDLQLAISNRNYSFAGALNNLESLADAAARFARFGHVASINHYLCLRRSLEPGFLLETANRRFTDGSLVVTSLSYEPLAEAMKLAPSISRFEEPAPTTNAPPRILVNRQPLVPQLNVKIQFRVGSGHDPAGKEGLASLTAALITGGSTTRLSSDALHDRLFAAGVSLTADVDRETTTLTLSGHRDQWATIADVALQMILEPAFRRDDFRRLRDDQMDRFQALLANDAEVAREKLQERSFRGTPYAHPSVGTRSGILNITLRDSRSFARENYTRDNLAVALTGDVPEELVSRLRTSLAKLPTGVTAAPVVTARPPSGISVEMIPSQGNGAVIALGHPIAVTRTHSDFAALSVARAWFGAHHSPISRLSDRISRARGLNSGAFAYIEAFPRAGSLLTPEPNTVRRNQIFEVFLTPLAPQHAHMALRIALYELRKMISDGLSDAEFEIARDYLLRSLTLASTSQNHQNGQLLDDLWYSKPDFPSSLLDRVARLTRAEVNAAIRKHLSAEDVFITVMTPDVNRLRQSLLEDEFTSISYPTPVSETVVKEDREIGGMLLNIESEDVRGIARSAIFP
jgi:zinc protease